VRPGISSITSTFLFFLIGLPRSFFSGLQTAVEARGLKLMFHTLYHPSIKTVYLMSVSHGGLFGYPVMRVRKLCGGSRLFHDLQCVTHMERTPIAVDGLRFTTGDDDAVISGVSPDYAVVFARALPFDSNPD
jgi:hypothetical protein